MAERLASLPMYEIAETAAATDTWWTGIAGHFVAAGLANPPAGLTRPGKGPAFWLGPELLFSQTCGYPFVTSLAGRVSLLATPCYDAPGCDGPDYCSLVIVRKDAPWEAFGDLRGHRCAVNGMDSWSGHHAIRLLIALEGGQDGCFCRATATGSHADSIAAVAGGQADFAAVDCVTHATLARHRPSAVAATRVLCRTPAMPGLPLIAGRAATAREIAAMREGLAAAAADPGLAEARKALGIVGMHFPPESEYGRLSAAVQKTEAAGVVSLL